MPVVAGRTDQNCALCMGVIECRGGGFLQCRKRDPRPSQVASVLDPYGGSRVVVTYKEKFKHHVRSGEVLVKVPGLTVHEPIAWGDIPGLLARADYNVLQWIEHNEKTNDPEKQEVIRAYKSKLSRHVEVGSLNLTSIAYT